MNTTTTGARYGSLPPAGSSAGGGPQDPGGAIAARAACYIDIVIHDEVAISWNAGCTFADIP